MLDDHDVAAELVVDRLGGAAPECVQVLHEWRDAGRWAARLQPPGPGFRTAVPSTAVPPDLVMVREAGALRALERSWRRRGGAGDEERRVHWFLRAAALGPLRDSAARARRRAGWDPVPLDAVEVRAVRPGDRAPVLGRMWPGGVRLRVGLTARWVLAVHGTGRVVDEEGRFVVDVDDDGPLALAWRPQGPDLVPVLQRDERSAR